MWQWQSFVNFFFKSSCALCQRPVDTSICADCWAKVSQCQIPLHQSLTIQPFGKSSVMVLAWGEYTGDLRRAIATLKYNNQPMIGHSLGQALGQTWNQLMKQPHHQITQLLSKRIVTPKSRLLKSQTIKSQNIVAVPIPMHMTKLKKRGFNQAVLIADAFCRITGIPLAKHGLKRVSDTKAQFSLSIQEREQNLAGAFVPCSQWVRRSPNASILLIDDIYTTGATVRSAAHTLQKVGCDVLGVAAIARPRIYK
ncbi:MAG: ComF family protein [Cyanobacteria bacterium J06633_2]